MGTLHYGSSGQEFPFDDRLLSHLKAVIVGKLRRGEGFMLTWTETEGQQSHSIWLYPSIPLHFVFEREEHFPLDRSIFEALSTGANGSDGLRLTTAI
ncbi:hypothetical protein D9V32_01645 [Mycetocola tolaasinivorans]|uniref:DUF7882 domain-containing protein n=1 Tax=Mycetocola tolaasinivorans TaxID=76635 RepID=A0A3L7ADK4_9MICO|nr:hypothetical protein [Mycetocola tolaasinivorans]RLP78054.1 hypothetical protein D9V32_01645 [Mycetocola tolaasinivorans]